MSVYLGDVRPFLEYEDERFFNVVAKQTEDSFVYFDAQAELDRQWASPVQCFLELSKLGKREQEAAETARQAILSRLK